MGEITENQKRAWILASLAAPTAHLACGLSWTAALAVSLLAVGLRKALSRLSERKKGKYLCMLLSAAAAGEAVFFMQSCWPMQRDTHWILIFLLVLGAVMASGEKRQLIYGSIILWWLIAFLMGNVLLSAVPEIRWRNLAGKIGRGELKTAGRLLTVLATPALTGNPEERKSQWALIGMPAVFSVCAQGVINLEAPNAGSAPFYELSRSISLYGTLERMEALAWLGMMLGTFLYLAFLMCGAVQAEQTPGRRKTILLALSAAAAVGIGSLLNL